MMATVRGGLLMAIILLILGCSSADNGAEKQISDHKAVILSHTDSGGNFELQPGRTLKITLEENPTTGYRWQIAESDDMILKLLNRKYERADAEPGKLGVGGMVTFEFEAAGKGIAELKMVYIRATADSDTAGQFSVAIEVK